METLAEQWRPVVGHEGNFEVSNAGRVKTLPHEVRHWCGRMIPKPGGILKQSTHSGGYQVVALRDGKKHYVHKLVMAAFVGEANGRDVNHIDGDKTNNRLDNLEYCDRLHNVRHAIATGLQDNSGENNGGNRYSTEQILAAHAAVRRGATHREAAALTGVGEGTVEQVCKGKRWKHLGLAVIVLLLALTVPAHAEVRIVSVGPPRVVVEPPVTAPQAPVYLAYPTRRSNWSYPGNIRQHVMSGEHRGKLDPAWVAAQSDASLRAWHSDDHERRVKWEYVVRPSTTPATAAAKPKGASNCPTNGCPTSGSYAPVPLIRRFLFR